MPVYVKDQAAVLHVHVPKTGGTSIARFFKTNGFGVHYVDTGGPGSMLRFLRCPPQHMHGELIMTLFRRARFSFVFMTVREPMDRMLSEYKMRVRAKQTTLGLTGFVDECFQKYRKDPYAVENHIRPQADFLVPGVKVFRQEDNHGDELIASVEAALQVRFENREIDRANMAPQGLAVPIDPEEVASVRPLVRQFYEIDYTTFGYPL